MRSNTPALVLGLCGALAGCGSPATNDDLVDEEGLFSSASARASCQTQAQQSVDAAGWAQLSAVERAGLGLAACASLPVQTTVDPSEWDNPYSKALFAWLDTNRDGAVSLWREFYRGGVRHGADWKAMLLFAVLYRQVAGSDGSFSAEEFRQAFIHDDACFLGADGKLDPSSADATFRMAADKTGVLTVESLTASFEKIERHCRDRFNTLTGRTFEDSPSQRAMITFLAKIGFYAKMVKAVAIWHVELVDGATGQSADDKVTLAEWRAAFGYSAP